MFMRVPASLAPSLLSPAHCRNLLQMGREWNSFVEHFVECYRAGRYRHTLPTFFTTASVRYAAFRSRSARCCRDRFARATSSFDPSTSRRERSTAFLESAIRFLCRSSARTLSVSVMGRWGMARATTSTVRCVGTDRDEVTTETRSLRATRPASPSPISPALLAS